MERRRRRHRRQHVIDLLPAGIQLPSVSLHLDTDKEPEEQGKGGRRRKKEKSHDKELARRDDRGVSSLEWNEKVNTAIMVTLSILSLVNVHTRFQRVIFPDYSRRRRVPVSSTIRS